MEEDEDGKFEIEVRDGWELRYHKGKAGNYVGVTKRVGKLKMSYPARMSITKYKGDKRRQYPLATFKSAVKAAIAIAEARLDACGLPSPEGDRKPRTCAQPTTRHLP